MKLPFVVRRCGMPGGLGVFVRLNWSRQALFVACLPARADDDSVASDARRFAGELFLSPETAPPSGRRSLNYPSSPGQLWVSRRRAEIDYAAAVPAAVTPTCTFPPRRSQLALFVAQGADRRVRGSIGDATRVDTPNTR